MDNALAIIGFYFTLIGFISGLFFTRLDAWYGDVREFAGKYEGEEAVKNINVENCKKQRVTLYGLRQSSPRGSFIGVGIFTTALLVLSFFVPILNPAVNTFLFLHLPLILTIVLYWAGGTFLLLRGSARLKGISEKINAVLGSAAPGK